MSFNHDLNQIMILNCPPLIIGNTIVIWSVASSVCAQLSLVLNEIVNSGDRRSI